MIVWIASYPRSGNTFFRLVLDRLGKGPTYSIYNDPALDELALSDLIGHASVSNEELGRLKEDSRLYFVKTHKLPEDDDYPTIYIVRDGRDAIVSFAHYFRNIGKSKSSLRKLLARLITGRQGTWPTWSIHVQAWTGREKGKSVLVRYEDLIEDPIDTVSNALTELNIEIDKPVDQVSVPDFNELRDASPAFFRSGKPGSWQRELTAGLVRQFWRWNRDGMKVAGYELPEDRYPQIDGGLVEITLKEIGITDVAVKDPIMEAVCMPPYFGPEDHDDFNVLLQIAISRNPEKILEYGTAEGNSAANLCKFTSAKITTINSLPESTSGSHRTFDIDKQTIGRIYREYGYADRVTQIYGDTIDLVLEEYIGDDKFDLVIIDACHEYAYVINDFLSAYPYVSDKGCILFHDCSLSHEKHLEGVWLACAHLRKAGFNIEHIRGTWWGFWEKRKQDYKLDDKLLSILEHQIDITRMYRDRFETSKGIYESIINNFLEKFLLIDFLLRLEICFPIPALANIKICNVVNVFT